MATESPILTGTSSPSIITTAAAPLWRPAETVPLTIYSFPTLEPVGLESWSAKHLYLPLRRDILHQAVVFEGDATRQGTASAKTRWEVSGSRAKVHRQKGLGRARAGSKQSPTRRGGGKAFGPQPRDFSTGLNRKVYDLAWRTALSHRYRRGELVVCADGLDLPLPDGFLALAAAGRLGRDLEDGFVARYARALLRDLGWGRDHGRVTFITGSGAARPANLFASMACAGADGRALEVADVDVKDLLEAGRVVVERSALREMVERHQSDLVSRIFVHGVRQRGPPVGLGVVV